MPPGHLPPPKIYFKIFQIIFKFEDQKIKLDVVMDVVVEEVVDKELTKVVEQVNKELVKEFNEGLMKVYL